MADPAMVSRCHKMSCAVGVAAAIVGGLLACAGCFQPPSGKLQVWAVGQEESLAADSRPIRESSLFSASTAEIRLEASVNETVGCQLALRATQPLSAPLTVVIGDFESGSGRLAARDVVRVFRARSIRVEQFPGWYFEHTGRPAVATSFPDILVPWEAPNGGGPIRLSPGTTELLWLDVRVPPLAEAGQYVGPLNIVDTLTNTPLYSCRLLLTVWPLALPSAPTLPVICRVDPADLLVAHLGWPRDTPESVRLVRGLSEHDQAIKLVDETMRLLREHGTTPVLWCSFPRYRLGSGGAVAVDWNAYDRLVEGWITGTALGDSAPSLLWPVPVSLRHPDAAREGGSGSPEYGRLLAAYVRECGHHFEQRGWLDRAFVRPMPPEPLTDEVVRRAQEVATVISQSEARIPLVVHLPGRSLRGLGWLGAPAVDVPGADIWAPPAKWFEPSVMRQEAALGRQIWLLPDYPPYSPSLSIATLSTDAVALAWVAYRYQIDGLWVEHATEFGDVFEKRAAATPLRQGRDLPPRTEALIYPGSHFGLDDRPVPSIRLKRLRRGIQDHALLTLLERNGQRALARTLCERLVRWACTDACLENLLSCRPVGWSTDPRAYALARELIRSELSAPGVGVETADPRRLADWELLMGHTPPVQADVVGVRVGPDTAGLRAQILCSVLNCADRALEARWRFPTVPVGWQPVEPPPLSVAPRARQLSTLELTLAGLAYNTDGIYPFALALETSAFGTLSVPARLAVAVCPPATQAPAIDGDLSDWALASNNAAGDFRLVRGQRAGIPPEQSDRPTLGSQAFFCMDRERVYIAVRCWLLEGQPPLVHAHNLVPVDGSMPWGQDVVEILIDPRRTFDGTGSDLYVLQIKPNGVVVATHGCRTDPPTARVEPWNSGAIVAVQVQRRAWVVELALPLAALGRAALENPYWGFNITRLDARRGEYSSWSGARGYSYTPRALGNLVTLRP